MDPNAHPNPAACWLSFVTIEPDGLGAAKSVMAVESVLRIGSVADAALSSEVVTIPDSVNGGEEHRSLSFYARSQ